MENKKVQNIQNFTTNLNGIILGFNVKNVNKRNLNCG